MPSLRKDEDDLVFLNTYCEIIQRKEKTMQVRYIYGDVTEPVGIGNKIILNLCNINGQWNGNHSNAISTKYKKAKAEFIKWYKDSKKNKSTIPFQLGEIQIVDITKRGWLFGRNAAPDFWVANILALEGEPGVPPKSYRRPFRVAALKKGLARIASFARGQSATVHLPKIGCQPGEGGNWDIIETLLKEEVLESKLVPVIVYDVK